ncbi:prepilin peptidase [Kiloniella sp. EL199]|uniref:A24 family peptidase n=1 Tax=Kiloniella sp. EL199 TaxID=2107581 RepID=UPI000EA01219|nr:prepilin peptidase [Kiloniella sp. EL199]
MDPLFLTKLVFVSFVVLAMLMDLIQMRIPNILSLAMILLFPVAYWGSDASIVIWDHLIAMFVVLGVGVLLFAFKILGGGDVKFIASLSLWTGLGLLPSYVLILSLVGGAQVLLLLILRRFSTQIEYLLAKFNLVLPVWLRRDGGVPYGVSIGIAILILFDNIPLFAT